MKVKISDNCEYPSKIFWIKLKKSAPTEVDLQTYCAQMILVYFLNVLQYIFQECSNIHSKGDNIFSKDVMDYWVTVLFSATALYLTPDQTLPQSF